MALVRALAVAVLVLASLGVGPESACACSEGPALAVFVNPVYPSPDAGYESGDLGVIHPRYARRHLVQAYRRLLDLAPTGPDPVPEATADPSVESATGLETWSRMRADVTGAVTPRIQTYRPAPGLAFTDNCLDDAFRDAAATLRARVDRFGTPSAEVVDWLAAQDAVFANCSGDAGLVLPAAVGASLDPSLAKDRAYQRAAALFYATDYEGARAAFEAIAADRDSPWRARGRYLAARTLLRQAAVLDHDSVAAATLYEHAEAQFREVSADPSAGTVGEAAKRLAGFAAARGRPTARLTEVARTLMARGPAPRQDFVDFTMLMDGHVGNTVEYDYASVDDRDALEAVDLTAWILAFQGRGEGASAAAAAGWRRTRSLPWLVAALWATPATDALVPELLEAASRVPERSPGYASAVFLRARALLGRNERDAARALLSDLLDRDASSPEVARHLNTPGVRNLLRATRLRLATSMEELLVAAPRDVIDMTQGFNLPNAATASGEAFDLDASRLLTERLPLARQVEAATRTTLPPALRSEVAGAAWVRAVLLERDPEAVRAAAVLRDLSPRLARDLGDYLREPTEARRHRRAILTILRHPTLKTYVPTGDPEGLTPTVGDPDQVPPLDNFDHSLGNWWCSAAAGYQDVPLSALPGIFGDDDVAPFPAFLDADERAATDNERLTLAGLSNAPSYLARQAVDWAEATPTDPRAAEALARAVLGGRWGCTYQDSTAPLRRAFEVLHARFRGSIWARRTPYWYAGR